MLSLKHVVPGTDQSVPNGYAFEPFFVFVQIGQPQQPPMSELFYDRKHLKHFSAHARDAANLRYESEERQAQEELKHQTQVAQAQLKLTNENLHYNQQLVANQERQANILEQQAKDSQSHLQFQKDIAWLERSDSVGRFNYLLGRCRTEAVATIANEVFKSAKIARIPIKESLTASLRLATAAKQKSEDLPRLVEKTKAELDAARLAAFKGSAGWRLVGYLILVPSLAVPISLLLAKGKEPSLADLGLCTFLTLAATCPIGYMAIKALRTQHRNRMAAAASQSQLMQELAESEQNQKELRRSFVAIEEQVKVEYAAWISDAKRQLRGVFEEVLLGPGVEAIRQIVGREEKVYPTTLRIEWDQIGRGEMCSIMDDMSDSVVEKVVSTHGPELLAAQLNFDGEHQLAGVVSTSFHPLFGLDWDLSEEEQENGVDEQEEGGDAC